MIDKTPQAIHDEKEVQRREERETALRDLFKLESEFMGLSPDVKKRVKKDVLLWLGYDPSMKIRSQGLLIRVIYFKKGRDLHKMHYILSYYSKNKVKYVASDNAGSGNGDLVFAR